MTQTGISEMQALQTPKHEQDYHLLHLPSQINEQSPQGASPAILSPTSYNQI
jgi:hypothetical protein